MNLYNEIHGGPKGSSPESKITALQFLGKVPNPNAYTTPIDFLTYVKSLREPELKDLERFFEYIKEELRIEDFTQRRVDRGGKHYIFPRFLKPKASPGCKIILAPWIEQFVAGYVAGLVFTNFTLADLIREAKSE